MERKKALVAAASATLVLATSAAAIAANVSLLGDDDGDVGQLDADTVTNLVPEAESTTSTLPDGREVVVIDEWVVEPGSQSPAGPGTAGVDLSGDGLPDDDPTPGDDDATGGGSSSHDDADDDGYDDEYEDEYEDESHDDDDSDEDEHEDESHEDEHEDDD